MYQQQKRYNTAIIIIVIIIIALHLRAFVALRLIPVVRMLSFANGRLAE